MRTKYRYRLGEKMEVGEGRGKRKSRRRETDRRELGRKSHWLIAV